MDQAQQHYRHLYDGIKQRKQSLQPKFIGLIAALIIMVLCALNAGAVDINLWHWLSSHETDAFYQQLSSTVLWEIRAPRLLMTMTTGAGLALCGAILQSICRNPLADPGLIGVSSGAALFAAIALATGSMLQVPSLFSPYLVPISAFIGAGVSLILVLKLSQSGSGMNTLLLILSGVAINAGAMSLLGMVQYLVDDETLRQITFWSMGSYAGVGYLALCMTIVPVSVGAIYFWKIRQALMLMSCSEQQAKYQGIDTNKIKNHSLWFVAAIVAVCVSFTGIVGFVGLVVPHLCRMFISTHLKILIPCSLVCGALLVGTADIIARIIIIPAELPIGIITSLVGVPFFLYLIVKEKRRAVYV